MLLNGKRISGFQEIRDLPTEAIQRVEILPEEVALKYGYRADQRVVNFVLRRRFRAATVEASDRIATEGGRNRREGEIDLLRIRRDTRSNLHLSYQTRDARCSRSERDIVPRTSDEATAAGSTRRRSARCCRSARSFGANAVYARTAARRVGATLNARVDLNDSVGRTGCRPRSRPTAAARRARHRRRSTAGAADAASTSHLGTTSTARLGGWRWSLTGNYDRADADVDRDGRDAASCRRRRPIDVERDRRAARQSRAGRGDATGRRRPTAGRTARCSRCRRAR